MKGDEVIEDAEHRERSRKVAVEVLTGKLITD